jgi:hypothetical protein
MRGATSTSIRSGTTYADPAASRELSVDKSLNLVSLAVAVGCTLAVWRIALVIPLPLPLNYNEGWNAYHAVEALRGQPLYAGPSRFFFNNYPPLSFYVAAATMRLFGDPIIAGRWLSLGAFTGWALLLSPVARALGCGAAAARFGVLLFAVNTLTFTDYVGIDDPQLLGHLTASLGLFILVRYRRITAMAYVAGLLMTLALFVKLNLVVLPAASFGWLLAVDRRAAWRLGAASVVTGVVGCAAVVWMFGPGVLEQIASPRAFSLARLAGKSALWVARMIVPVSVAVVMARRPPRDEAVRLCSLYAGLAVGAGMLSVGGEGVNWNVFFDGTWALCLAAAMALDRLPRDEHGIFRSRRRLAAAYLLAPALALATNVGREWLTPSFWMQPRGAEAIAARADESFIAAHAGHALCEQLALCFWAGKPAEVDVFNMRQRILAGSRRDDELAVLLEQRYFAVVELDVPTRRLGVSFDEALRRNYRLVQERIDRRLFVPR